MTYSTDNRTDPRPEVRTGPTYVSKEKSTGAGWLIAGIVIVAAIVALLMLAPFNRTAVTTVGTTPQVENNVNVQPPAATAPSTTNMETQPAPQTTAPATPAAPATEPPAATTQPAQPAAPVTTP